MKKAVIFDLYQKGEEEGDDEIGDLGNDRNQNGKHSDKQAADRDGEDPSAPSLKLPDPFRGGRRNRRDGGCLLGTAAAVCEERGKHIHIELGLALGNGLCRRSLCRIHCI